MVTTATNGEAIVTGWNLGTLKSKYTNVAVTMTPGTVQKVFSTPQKHPAAKSAISDPAGYGPFRGWPLT